MIDIRKLRVGKSGRTICSVPNLRVAPGERVAIRGANGTGKTTMLRVLAGLETGFEGRLTVNASRRERVYVHQSPRLFRGTVLFNVTYGLRLRGTSRRESDRLGREWLRRLGVEKLSRGPVSHLSGGERRRIALAQAMILRPRLLLLDEPLADLDEEGAVVVLNALNQLEQCTILIASPKISDQGLTTRVYQLDAPAGGAS